MGMLEGSNKHACSTAHMVACRSCPRGPCLMTSQLHNQSGRGGFQEPNRKASRASQGLSSITDWYAINPFQDRPGWQIGGCGKLHVCWIRDGQVLPRQESPSILTSSASPVTRRLQWGGCLPFLLHPIRSSSASGGPAAAAAVRGLLFPATEGKMPTSQVGRAQTTPWGLGVQAPHGRSGGAVGGGHVVMGKQCKLYGVGR